MGSEVPEIERDRQAPCGQRVHPLALTVRGAVAVAVAVTVPFEKALVIAVMLGGRTDRREVGWNVRGEGIAADMLQVVRRLMTMRAFGCVLFVVAVLPVAAVHQRPRDLPDAVHVDEQKGDQ